MAERNLVLQLLITAKDQASSILSGIKTQLAALAEAVVATFSTRGAMDFEVALSKLAARADETGPALKELIDEARDAAQTLGPKFGVSATEAAGGLTSLVAAGFTAKEAISALPGVLALAAMEGIGLEQAATLISDAISQFGLKAADATKVANVLAAAAGAVAATATDMGEALKYTGTAASQAGLSLTETAAILDVLGKAGQRGSEAGTGLSAVLSILANPTHTATKALFEMGATSTQLGDVLTLIQSHGLKAADMIGLFGEQGGRVINTLIAQGGTAAIAKFAEEIEHSGRTAEQSAKIMKDNLSGALDRFWESLKRVGVELASPSLPGYTAALDSMTAALNRVVSNQAIHAFSDRLQSAFSRLGQMATDVGKAIFDAFAGIDWNSVSGSSSTAFDSIQSAAGRAVSALQSLIAPLLGGFPDAARVAELATGAWNAAMKLASGTAELIASVMERLSVAFNKATGATQEVGSASDQASGQMSALRQEQEKAIGATEGQVSGYRRLLDALKDFSTQTVPRVIGDAADAIGAWYGALYKLGDLIADFVAGALTDVRAGYESVLNVAARMVEGMSALVGVFSTSEPVIINAGKAIGSAVGAAFSGLAGVIGSLGFAVLKLTETVMAGWLEIGKLTRVISDEDAAKLSARIARVGVAAEALKKTAENSFGVMIQSIDGVGSALSGAQSGAGSAGGVFEELGKKAATAASSLEQSKDSVATLTKALEEQQSVVDRLAEENARGKASTQEYGDAVQKLWEIQKQLKDAQDRLKDAQDRLKDSQDELKAAQDKGADAAKKVQDASDKTADAVKDVADEMDHAAIVTATFVERQQAAALTQTKSADAAKALYVEVQKGTLDVTKNSIAWATAETAQKAGVDAAGKLGAGLYEIKKGSDAATDAATRHAAAVKAMGDSVNAGATIQVSATQATDKSAAALQNLRATYIATNLAYQASEAALARGEITQQEATKTRNAARDALNAYNNALGQNVEGAKKFAEATDASAKAAIDAAKADIELSRSKGDLWSAGQKTVTLAQIEAELAEKQATAKLAQIAAERAEIQAKLDQKQAIEHKLDSDKVEITILEAKLIAIGKSIEAAQLEAEIKKQLAINAQQGTQATQQNTQATQQNTQATQQNTDTKRRNEEVTRQQIKADEEFHANAAAGADLITRILSGWSTRLEALSPVSRKMFDSFIYGTQAATKYLSEMDLKMKEIEDKQRVAYRGMADYGFVKWANTVASKALEIEKNFWAQADAADRLVKKLNDVGNSANTLQQLADQAENAARDFNQLDNTRLDQLAHAIETARKKIDELHEATVTAQQRLAQLDEELAREQGDTHRADILRQQIEYEQQRAEIQRNLQAAEAAHNQELIQLYQQQMERLNDLNALRIRNIENENKKPKPDAKPGASTSEQESDRRQIAQQNQTTDALAEGAARRNQVMAAMAQAASDAAAVNATASQSIIQSNRALAAALAEEARSAVANARAVSTELASAVAQQQAEAGAALAQLEQDNANALVAASRAKGEALAKAEADNTEKINDIHQDALNERARLDADFQKGQQDIAARLDSSILQINQDTASGIADAYARSREEIAKIQQTFSERVQALNDQFASQALQSGASLAQRAEALRRQLLAQSGEQGQVVNAELGDQVAELARLYASAGEGAKDNFDAALDRVRQLNAAQLQGLLESKKITQEQYDAAAAEAARIVAQAAQQAEHERARLAAEQEAKRIALEQERDQQIAASQAVAEARKQALEEEARIKKENLFAQTTAMYAALEEETAKRRADLDAETAARRAAQDAAHAEALAKIEAEAAAKQEALAAEYAQRQQAAAEALAQKLADLQSEADARAAHLATESAARQAQLQAEHDQALQNIQAEHAARLQAIQAQAAEAAKPPAKPASPEPSPVASKPAGGVGPPTSPGSASPVFTLNLVLGSKTLIATTNVNPSEFLSALERGKALSVSP